MNHRIFLTSPSKEAFFHFSCKNKKTKTKTKKRSKKKHKQTWSWQKCTDIKTQKRWTPYSFFCSRNVRLLRWKSVFWSTETWCSQVKTSCQYIVPITHKQYIQVSSSFWISPVTPISSRLVYLWKFSFEAHTACCHIMLHNEWRATAESWKCLCEGVKEVFAMCTRLSIWEM